MNKTLMKNTLREGALGISISMIIMLLIFFFHPPFNRLLAGFLTYNLVTKLYKAYVAGWHVNHDWGLQLIVGAAILSVFITTIYLLSFLFGGWGLLGIIIICVLLGVWIIIRRWNSYLFWVREIERMIFGKTMEERKGGEKK